MGSEHFFKKFVVDLKADSPCCPLCHRGFEQEQEIRELILEVSFPVIPFYSAQSVKNPHLKDTCFSISPYIVQIYAL